MHADLGHGFLRAVFGDVFTRLDFADDLKLGALGQSSGVFGSAAERDAFVPVVCDSRSPVWRFFQVRLVASEGTVRVELLRAARDSASEPRYPALPLIPLYECPTIRPERERTGKDAGKHYAVSDGQSC